MAVLPFACALFPLVWLPTTQAFRTKPTKVAFPQVVWTNHTMHDKQIYDWHEFLPRNVTALKVLQWIMTGSSMRARTHAQRLDKLNGLARLLLLLRAYQAKYGVPTQGGPTVQRHVLAQITSELYASGAPVWVLSAVMDRVAEGLTGLTEVQYFLLPHRCFIFYPSGIDNNRSDTSSSSTTGMFKINPGYDIARLDAVEQVAIRLASYASNTPTMERLLVPKPFTADELAYAQQRQQDVVAAYLRQVRPTEPQLAQEILHWARHTYGLFFLLNHNPVFPDKSDASFWTVAESTRQIFTRLAAHEAAQALQQIAQAPPLYYTPSQTTLLRILSAAGASGLWFGGSLSDMIVAGVLAVLVAKLDQFTHTSWWRDERMLTEVLASVCVGCLAGLLALQWPAQFSFGAIAIPATMEIMQGFKVVYSAIEVLSKNIVSGSSRCFESILITGLISYSLRFGLNLAHQILRRSWSIQGCAGMLQATNPISSVYFPLLLPISAVAWSGLFRPLPQDLPIMAFHGILAFVVTFLGAPIFVAAMAVTFSAGIFSRFTGKQALGSTLAGLYALVPGTYMVRALLSDNRVNFLESVLVTASTIGLGAWAGTLLCSPTILGQTSGWTKGEKSQTMLYF